MNCVIGHFVDESDLVTHILDSLIEEYAPVVMNVVAAKQTDHVLVAYVHGLFLNMEMCIAHHRSSTSSPSGQTTSALFTHKTGTNNNHGHGGNRTFNQGHRRDHSQQGDHNSGNFTNSQGSGKNINSSCQNFARGLASMSFQICNRLGHSALGCYHRMDHTYQGRHPLTKPAAMAVSNQFHGDQIWYIDTGATDHITFDVGNLSFCSDYHGLDKVSIGNGLGLCISHIGFSTFSTPNS